MEHRLKSPHEGILWDIKRSFDAISIKKIVIIVGVHILLTLFCYDFSRNEILWRIFTKIPQQQVSEKVKQSTD
jgi:hypothetical protein